MCMYDCYIARLSLKKMSTKIGWFLAPDQIQMYPGRDPIAQLLPARRLCWYACKRESLKL